MKIKRYFFNFLTAASVAPLAFSFTQIITSCANKESSADNIKFEKIENNIIENKANKATVTCRFYKRAKPQKIDSCELYNSDNRLTISSFSTDLQEDGSFTVDVSFKREIEQTINLNFGLIITYSIGSQEYYEIIEDDQMTITLDYHTLTLINQTPEMSVSGDTTITYTFKLNGLHFPQQIDSVYLQGSRVDALKIEQDTNIPIDPYAKTFDIKLSHAYPSPPEADDIEFTLSAEMVVLGQHTACVGKTCHFIYYYPSIQFVRQTTDYLLKDKQICDFVFLMNLPSIRIEKIDKVSVVFDTPIKSGSLTLEKDTNIPINNNNTFVVSLYYRQLDTPGEFDDISFNFKFDFTTAEGYEFKDFSSEKFQLTAYRENEYKGTWVNFVALENCTFSIENQTPSFEGTYNIKYRINDAQEAQSYALPTELGQSGPTINLNAGDNIQISNNTGHWNYGGNLGSDRFKFCPKFHISSPVLVQGDITALLDGVGGNEEDLSTYDKCVFAATFRDTNVVKVSDDFLKPTKLGDESYACMFENSNLVCAPELPATTLGEEPYYKMFSGCHSLVIPPKWLPAQSAGMKSYSSMFYDCTALSYSPIIMLAEGSQDDFTLHGTFSGCKNLKEIYIPSWNNTLVDYTIFTDWVKAVSDFGILFYNGDEAIHSNSSIPVGWEVREIEPLI